MRISSYASLVVNLIRANYVYVDRTDYETNSL
jgi:hypothetical protein